MITPSLDVLGIPVIIRSDANNTRPRYFAASDWMAVGIAFFLALLVYVLTLAPTVTLEYSGALVVAADHLGVARPPGYPIWTLVAKGFICLFPFATYHGHPNPA